VPKAMLGIAQQEYV